MLLIVCFVTLSFPTVHLVRRYHYTGLSRIVNQSIGHTFYPVGSTGRRVIGTPKLLHLTPMGNMNDCTKCHGKPSNTPRNSSLNKKVHLQVMLRPISSQAVAVLTKSVNGSPMPSLVSTAGVANVWFLRGGWC